jgi:alpha-L-fucosidase 2
LCNVVNTYINVFTNNMKKNAVCLLALLMIFSSFTGKKNIHEPPGRPVEKGISQLLNDYNVSWDVPGPGSAQSMPIGNGDIGLNVWVEANGDLAFYISKTDAWGGEVNPDWDPWMKQGGVLMKLGLIHVSLRPNIFVAGTPFRQVLRLSQGEIQVKEGNDNNGVLLRVWVDANHPVIRVEAKSQRPVSVKVTLDNWRINNGETILPARTNANNITWYHRNAATADSHLANLTFGASIKGKGLISRDDTTLQSNKSVTYQLISINPLTAKTNTASQWLDQLGKQTAIIDQLKLEQSRVAHQKWWTQFWHRSWIFLQGNDTAASVTRGYILQRFVTACAGRGAYPIKFNGSIFVVDYPKSSPGRGNGVSSTGNADYRAWGGQYWFQNTRAMYWPRLMAGDFDEMLPLFRMYAKILPDNVAQVKTYYHHGGAYFAETSPFWGGLLYMGPEVKANYTNHYFTPILELSMMMLDYFEYTGDKKFARETLLPIATAGLEFFNQHFGRDSLGKLLLDPDNAIEMFWKVHNPAPDIAGLHAVLAHMVTLPDDLVDRDKRLSWQKMINELPDLPVATNNGNPLLLPYTGEQTAKFFNLENPELYAIYPFRLYGVDKPGLSTTINTFNNRKYREKGCWVQDPIQAAMLGQADVAKQYVSFALTRKEPGLKFPAFWAVGHDYTPDEDNGGNGENGLQQMLMQTNGKKILLLPAWPKEWDAVFKLNAPYQTTVEGKVVHGKLINLVVTPAARAVDVIDMSDRKE